MKRTALITFLLAFAIGAVVAPDASAGMFNKNKGKAKRTEKPEWMKQPRRFDNQPTMAFQTGVLQQDGWTGWTLGDLSLQFTKDCVVMEDGAESGNLTAGRTAVVMGPKFGDTILAWNIRVLKPSFAYPSGPGEGVQIEYSDTNPNCGEIISSPK